jgi:hypothetical protein
MICVRGISHHPPDVLSPPPPPPTEVLDLGPVTAAMPDTDTRARLLTADRMKLEIDLRPSLRANTEEHPRGDTQCPHIIAEKLEIDLWPSLRVNRGGVSLLAMSCISNLRPSLWANRGGACMSYDSLSAPLETRALITKRSIPSIPEMIQ